METDGVGHQVTAEWAWCFVNFLAFQLTYAISLLQTLLVSAQKQYYRIFTIRYFIPLILDSKHLSNESN